MLSKCYLQRFVHPGRVKQQAGWRRTKQGRYGESCQDQRGVKCLADGPADDYSAVEVQSTCDIEPAFVGENIGYIGEADLVGSNRLWGGRRLGTIG